MNRDRIYKVVVAGLMTAMCYIGFVFIRIDIPVAGSSTAIHLGNAFCVLAALLLGGVYGGAAGAVGMTLADLSVPAYVMVAPKTFVLKFCIGLICGTVAHKVGHIEQLEGTRAFKWSALSCGSGLLFNIIFEPIISYFYKMYVQGMPSDPAKILAVWTAGATFINAITSLLVACFLYSALRPVLRRINAGG